MEPKVRFELTRPLPEPDYKSGGINHSPHFGKMRSKRKTKNIRSQICSIVCNVGKISWWTGPVLPGLNDACKAPVFADSLPAQKPKNKTRFLLLWERNSKKHDLIGNQTIDIIDCSYASSKKHLIVKELIYLYNKTGSPGSIRTSDTQILTTSLSHCSLDYFFNRIYRCNLYSLYTFIRFLWT